ncbi:hypothetical protein PPL_07566 [Heterostelium album PN500]|uniref:Uncharacterized protein n=1 Tax=Heterostelium pallidum (strain ATCC 26659 / Pp 5 / PN500) TaxID=670386 RepID=D3BGB5_HETP5|nr:hypothetical protein PPL_07566 [Heterostelium album PN500]EFA79515.1 hypothetical protein PPL_07566 [Heterostelium album PN500]|eukprot:XP_020431636.1 hypothetical protein PPL_07566 [Heterostelium album PN500]
MEFSKYETFTHGFTLEYPKGWKVVENMGFSVALFTPPISSQSQQENGMLNLNVSIQDLKGMLLLYYSKDKHHPTATGSDVLPSSDEFLEISKQQVVQMGAKSLKYGSTKIGSGEQVHDGYYMSYMLENEGTLLKINQSFFIKDYFTYVITLSVPSREASLLEVYEKAVSSFGIFSPKGYKYIILDEATGTLTVDDNNKSIMRYNLFAPKQWKVTLDKRSETSTIIQYQSEKDNLTLIHSIEQFPKQVESVSKFLSQQAQRVRTRADRDSTVDLSSSMAKLVSLPSCNVEFLRLQYKSKGQDQQIAMVVIGKQHVFTTTLISAAGDMKHWSNILDAVLAGFKLTEEGNSNTEGELLSYSIFAHLIKSYALQIPKHFEVAAKFSTNEAIMFTSTKSKIDNPVFSITYEDIGSAVNQEEYKQLIMHFHNESLEQPRVASDKITRLDKYKASLVEMLGFDRQIGNEQLKATFKCAVVKRRYGVLLSFRTTRSEYDSLYSSCFFIFDSFKLI